MSTRSARPCTLAASSPSSCGLSYATCGNLGNTVTILCCAVYALLVVSEQQSDSHTNFLDSSYKNNGGFCITAKDSLYSNSHHVSFYVDTVLTMVSLAVYNKVSKTRGIPSNVHHLVFGSIFGLFMHGLGHAVIAHTTQYAQDSAMTTLLYNDKNMTKNNTTALLDLDQAEPNFTDFMQSSRFNYIVAFHFLIVFYFVLLQAVLGNLTRKSVAVISLMCVLVQARFITFEFTFVYVQTLVVLACSVNFMISPTKSTLSYASFPWMVSCPLVLIGWLEGTSCDSFVRDKLYGHAVYDASCGMLVMAWYIMLHKHHQAMAVKSKVN